MIKVKSLESLSTLPITEALQDQVKAILIEPFEDEVETQQVWDDLQCELWMLTSLSDIPTHADDRRLLAYALEYIEFADPLEQDHILSLSIVDNAGKGIYLLMPKQLLGEIKQAMGVSND